MFSLDFNTYMLQIEYQVLRMCFVWYIVYLTIIFFTQSYVAAVAHNRQQALCTTNINHNLDFKWNLF